MSTEQLFRHGVGRWKGLNNLQERFLTICRLQYIFPDPLKIKPSNDLVFYVKKRVKKGFDTAIQPADSWKEYICCIVRHFLSWPFPIFLRCPVLVVFSSFLSLLRIMVAPRPILVSLWVSLHSPLSYLAPGSPTWSIESGEKEVIQSDASS